MNVLIIMGSPRLNGNTAELLKPFMQALSSGGASVSYTPLAGRNILPCQGCYACQDVSGSYGCVLCDDVPAIMDDIIACDCLVLATPIYSWYCTASMKALLDRHFGLNKFYRKASGSLWQGKKIALITTHGYDGAYATSPFETGIKRLIKHSHLRYMGMYSVQDEEGLCSFQTEAAVSGAVAFAHRLLGANRG